jgi:hypothetical protein
MVRTSYVKLLDDNTVNIDDAPLGLFDADMEKGGGENEP